jgi:hypothetical protein
MRLSNRAAARAIVVAAGLWLATTVYAQPRIYRIGTESLVQEAQQVIR